MLNLLPVICISTNDSEKAHRFIEWGIGIDFHLPNWIDLVGKIDFTEKKPSIINEYTKR